jgi:hypothetical protein
MHGAPDWRFKLLTLGVLELDPLQRTNLQLGYYDIDPPLSIESRVVYGWTAGRPIRVILSMTFPFSDECLAPTILAYRYVTRSGKSLLIRVRGMMLAHNRYLPIKSCPFSRVNFNC